MKTPIGILAAVLSLTGAVAHAQEYQPGDEYQQYPEQPEQQPQQYEDPQAYGQAPQQQDVNFEVFQNALSPYGEWVEAPGYGRVWRPAGVSASWRPYTQGRWIWTAYGWTWVGNEPWAWAPYHYGRWVRIASLGWSWMPDYTWGPAWVSFRFGADAVGWAPLGPGYGYEDSWYDEYAPDYGMWSFVSYGSFYVGPSVVNYNLCNSIYSPSYVRANVWVSTRPAQVFGVGGGRAYGPPCSTVSSRSGTQVTSVPIHSASGIAGAHTGFDGHSVNVVAPPFHGVAHPFGGQSNVPGNQVIGVGGLLGVRSNPPVTGGVNHSMFNEGQGNNGNHGTVAPQTARPAPPSRPAFSDPQRPAFNQPSFNQPSRPAFQQPSFAPAPQRPVMQQPSFSQPSRPAFQQPGFSQPSRPAFQQPSFNQASRPSFSAPSRPSFQPQPSRPSFSAPSRPAYQAPSRPSFGGFGGRHR
ncbi:MAG: hypothetical protein QM723_01290 [Myxococcaceae bacterium]